MTSVDGQHSAGQAALSRLGHRGGPLAIGGCSAEGLAEEFGTPLYAYDADAFVDQIEVVRTAFGPAVDVLFALKANPSLALARLAHAAGAGAEVASAGEILLAESAGFPPHAIQMAGPGKSTRDHAEALRVGVTINLESEREYERLCAHLGLRRPRVQIRVNPMVGQDGARLRMADASSRFGIDRDRVVAFAERIRRDDAMDLVGLHTYGGSQAFSAEGWLRSTDDMFALTDEVERALGRPLESLGLGGGFGWPVYEGDPVFDLATAARGVRDRLTHRAVPIRASIELGRYLAAGCGVYLTRVIERKLSGGRPHIVVDGGMHHFGAAAGLGAVMRRAYAMVRADDPRAAPAEAQSPGGVLCTPADRFGRDLALPVLNEGDLLAILNAGAYGYTFSPLRFLGHETPAEVVCSHGLATLARLRGTPEDVLHGQL